jgi:ABC-2 type transport system ATP-binding protein
MEKHVLEVINLSKKFDQFVAVDNISFSIDEGEIVGFLGPNGAGKTTTLQMLLGLMQPTSGDIRYFDLSFKKNREKTLQRINQVTGHGRLPYRLTAWEVLRVFAELYEVKDPKQKILKLAETFSCREILKNVILNLSSGQLVRVLFVKAFLNDPELLLLDEPTTGLDPFIAEKVWEFILEEKKKRNITILLTSHNMKEVERICDRVIFLNGGRILEINTPMALAKKINESEINLLIEKDREKFLKWIEKKGFQIREKFKFFSICVPTSEIPVFLKEISENNINYSEIEIVKPTLEDFFIRLSKKENL